MKVQICLALATASAFAAVTVPQAAKPAVKEQAHPLPLTAVRLTGGPLKNAQDLDRDYLLKLEPDRMLYLLRERAGLKPKGAKPYEGWDGPDGKQLTGHIAGHYLSAVSLMYAATSDIRYKQRSDYMVKELKEIQDKQGDGYLGALTDAKGTPGKQLFEEIARGDIRSGGFDLNGLWSPWYVEHKLFAGLRDAYRHCGNREALEVERKFAGWAERILSKLNDEQIQKMLNTEFGAMNEVAADLYLDTGEKRWMVLSDKFQHHALVDPLAQGKDILGGKHANTQVPKLLGSLVRYVATGNEADGKAARFFWDEVAHHHSFSTGGHGRNEYFGEPDKLNRMVDGRTAETCNAYNMIKMSRALFALKPDMAYADFHERTLYNHILASMDPKDGWTCYMTPVGRGVQHEYEENMLEGGFTCCVGSGMESHALHAYGLYYEAGKRLWVNLYAPSTAEWKAQGVKLSMETSFPEGEAATLRLELKAPRKLTLALRRPWWAGEGFKVAVNGQPLATLPQAGSYVELDRTWKNGDKVELVLPKALHLEPLLDNPRRASLMWGPLALAGDLGEERREWGPREVKDPVPVFLSAEKPLADWLKPVPGKANTWMSQGGTPRDVEFVPFYRLHRRLYGVYWDLFTPAEWQAKSEAYQAEQARQRRLEAATVAYAQPGEMQPETDFRFQHEGTRVARAEERAARIGGRWFSFEMPVDPAHPAKVLVTFNDEDRSAAVRHCDILVDGRKVGEEEVKRRSPEVDPRFWEVECLIPAETIQGKSKVTVRLQAAPGQELPPICGVRIIRADAQR